YATLEDAAREKAGAPPTRHMKLIWHPRTLVYFAIWVAIGLALLFALGTRRHLDLAVQKDRNPPFMLLSDGSVRNAWTLKLKNMEGRPRPMKVALEGLPGAVMWTDTMGRDQATRSFTETVAADTIEPVRVYVAAPAGTHEGEVHFVMTAIDQEGGSDRVATRFDAPENEEGER
ncbi:MAG: cytochrome c oxidase accessory protein CcoG, partial [Sphingomonadales bacterium]|nr:cytochrome c oxidase accessory protein CcoG [Sphingomonadales bacterium]